MTTTTADSTGQRGLAATTEARAIVAASRNHGRSRAIAITTALAVATFAVVCISVSIGDFPIALRDVVPSIFGFGASDTTFIVQEIRLPRIVCGLLVGFAFGMSGTVFQSLVRNELASPDVIGITAGASTAAVVAIVLFGSSSISLSFAALLGGLGTAGAIYLFAYKRGVSGYRLILVGIGIAAGLSSVTSYLITRAEITDVQRATIWLTGSLNGRTWDQVATLAVVIAVLLPTLLLLARGLRALQLGDDAAKGIGVRVEGVRAAIIIAAVGLAAFGTAVAGPVAFVAFVSGPIARRLVASGDIALLPSALVGAVLLLSADLVARAGLGSIELPVGVLTGILGAPYLLWLLARTNRMGTGD
ncbi:MAG: iron chelate uptake ABC transporter family permease subunit [Solirubrobacteraceae bacterium]|nr:iron chelate uptake ABC transporter family permease subunit [Solirubrobacteraceae bacterium]